MNQLQVFNFEHNNLRVTIQDGQPWWIAKDICDLFGETNRNRAMQNLDEDEKGYTQMITPGGNQKLATVNESGLYSLLFAMRPTKARGVGDEHILQRERKLKQFKRWVTDEVLPSIRKTGSYSVTGYTPSQQLQAIFMLDGRQQEIESRMERLENNTTIDYGQQLALKKAGNVAIMILIGGKESPAYQNRSLRGKAFAAFWSNYKDYFNVNSINNTLVKDYDRGLDYVHRLTLPGELLREIDTANMQITM